MRIVLLILLASLGFTSANAAQASEPIDIGSRLELMVDKYLIDELEGSARLLLHEPIDQGPVLQFDKPWEGPFCAYVTIIKDGDVYRAYYRGTPVAGDHSEHELTCYAESKDGIHWIKPKLNLFKIDGSKANSVILAGARPNSHNFSPFLDTNPNAPKDQRYKALAVAEKSAGLDFYVSPDGIHWKKLQEEPLFKDSGWVFDSQNLAFWSEHEGQYVLYYRKVPKGYPRAIARATSKDFINWSEPTMMTYSDTQSAKPSQHLYTNQTQPYFRAPHIYIATPARFMPGRKVVSDEEAKTIGVDPKYYGDTSDSVFMTSRGGTAYDRTFTGALIKPDIGLENWVSRTNYPALNIVQTGKTEMSLYVQGDYAQPTAHLRRYTFRLDGFASVRADFEGGQVLTRPLTFDGQQLFLNYSTSAAGGIRVEVLDAGGKPIPGFAAGDCREIIGNEIERAVVWTGGDLSKLADKPIRLRFIMQDADLFAFRFR